MRSKLHSPRPRSASEEPHDLVPRLLAGDEALFTSLVTRWHSGLLQLAEALTRDFSTAEEVVHETWASVLRSLGTFEDRTSFRTWVHRICAQVALAGTHQEVRSPAPRDPVVDPARFDERGHWRSPPGRWPDETSAPIAVPREMMESALGTLPVDQRAVITLRDVQGFSAGDACEILGVSEVHQRVLLHRARSRIRAECDRFHRQVA